MTNELRDESSRVEDNAESLADRVRGILAERPEVRGAEVAKLLGINDRSAHALVSYARKNPVRGGVTGRGASGGARVTTARSAIPSWGDESWSAVAAPLRAFLASKPEGASHAEIKAWWRKAGGMSTTKLVNALAWLESRGLARSEGEKNPIRPKARAVDSKSRLHLVRWFGTRSG